MTTCSCRACAQPSNRLLPTVGIRGVTAGVVVASILQERDLITQEQDYAEPLLTVIEVGKIACFLRTLCHFHHSHRRREVCGLACLTSIFLPGHGASWRPDCNVWCMACFMDRVMVRALAQDAVWSRHVQPSSAWRRTRPGYALLVLLNRHGSGQLV
jgi:hypothetical protein